jgi:threonine synthase
LTATPRCAGCGATPPDEALWACPNRGSGDDVDHVIARHMDLAERVLVTSDHPNPFVRYRSLLYAHDRWAGAGRDDGEFVDLVGGLDAAVAEVDGRGFRHTPFGRHPSLDAATRLRVWVKDETGNVSGSHKGRHVFGLMVALQALDRLGVLPVAQRTAPLAIASCGNAALAAAVVAAAGRRWLQVFVPEWADPAVIDRLRGLGADIRTCPRLPGRAGDPAYAEFRQAVAGGAVPFGCQGPDNGLTIEGGQTLGWELAEDLAGSGARPQRLLIQVGGGALATACARGLAEARTLDGRTAVPALHAVQTAGAAPLARAHARLVARIGAGATPAEALVEAARHRSDYMWPWEAEPAGIATGILDDETYDWLGVVSAMVETGGDAVVVDDALVAEATELARRTTGIDVDETGSVGLAGVLAELRAGRLAPGAEVVVVFTGVRRRPPTPG